jgi:hypothetical protein
MQEQERVMKRLTYAAGIGSVVALAVSGAFAFPFPNDTRNETRMEIAADGTVNVINSAGSVNVHSGSGRQVVVVYTTHSPNLEVDESSSPDRQRVEVRTHILHEQK